MKDEKKTFEVKWVMSIGALLVLAIDIISEGYFDLEFTHIAILLVAALPFFSEFIQSFSASADGFELKFRERLERVEDVIEAGEEPDQEAPETVEVTEQDAKALGALTNSKYTMRSLSGIRNDAGLSANEVGPTIERLVENGLAKEVQGKTGTKWIATRKGLSALKSKT